MVRDPAAAEAAGPAKGAGEPVGAAGPPLPTDGPGTPGPQPPAPPASAGPPASPAGDPSAHGFHHLPTVVGAPGAVSPAPPPPPVAYGYPQPAYNRGPYAGGVAVPGAGTGPGAGSGTGPGAGPGTGPGTGTVPGMPPYGWPSPAPYDRGRNTALLVVLALLVALVVGGGVYVFTSSRNKGAPEGPQAAPTSSPTAAGGLSEPATSGNPGEQGNPAATSPGGPASSETQQQGIPDAFLGTWSSSLDGAGRVPRHLTVHQGRPGDTVLSVVADGPLKNGTYHCEFEADLAATPGAGGPVRIGPSRVIAGEPRSSCTPGNASKLTLLPDGRLRRDVDGAGEDLTYTRD